MTVDGNRIRQARHAAHMTQAGLAQAIGTRERNIIRWENDQHEPRAENIAAIARATGHPLEFFLNGTSEEDDEEAALDMSLEDAIQAVKQSNDMLADLMLRLVREKESA